MKIGFGLNVKSLLLFSIRILSNSSQAWLLRRAILFVRAIANTLSARVFCLLTKLPSFVLPVVTLKWPLISIGSTGKTISMQYCVGLVLCPRLWAYVYILVLLWIPRTCRLVLPQPLYPLGCMLTILSTFWRTLRSKSFSAISYQSAAGLIL